MTPEELTGFGLVLGVVLAAGVLVLCSRLSPTLKALICAGLLFRVVGSWLRYTILFEEYRGRGDARVYYRRGLEYADRFWNMDFSPFFDPSLWLNGRWWGTQFMSFPSGVVLSAIGPSLLGAFLAFSLLSFLGLVGFAVAFRRSYPAVPLSRYVLWIWLFPSLWFWPSSVGKDAIVLMGLGLAVCGFVGYRERVNWPLMALGTFFVFAIRPQVAAVLILSFILADWLAKGRRWTTRRAFQGALILAAGLAGIWTSMTYIGVDGFDAEGVVGYMEDTSARAAEGGSAVENVDVGLTGVPKAMLNILSRPFPWEARNAMAFLSALEIAALWLIIWFRRHNLLSALRVWRSHRLLRLAVPFLLLYSISLGMLVVNLGIIARQRIFLFPFLFLLLEAVPALERRRTTLPRRKREIVPRPSGHELVGTGR